MNIIEIIKNGDRILIIELDKMSMIIIRYHKKNSIKELVDHNEYEEKDKSIF